MCPPYTVYQGLKYARYPDILRILKPGFGYQTVNDLYPDWIPRKLQTTVKW